MSDADEIRALRHLVQQSQGSQEALLKVVTALLMFHSGSTWTVAERGEWTRLTGDAECTTRSLCDFARKTLKALVVSS